MASQEEFDALKGRIEELENKLAAAGASASATAAFTPEEMAAYQKVRDVIAADYGDFCGINDCFRPQRCIKLCDYFCVQRCIQRCIFECTCGPCNIGPMTGGIERFGGLGG